MRIAPILIPHLSQPSPILWADTVLAGMITHNDEASNASCVALIGVLWKAIGLSAVPAPTWWIEQFCSVLEQLEGDTRYCQTTKTLSYEGPLWRLVREQVPDALARDLTVVDACNSWHSGAYLLQTVPSVLYILCKHASHPETAILSAVNDTKDNDTVAAIVGAVVGALHGKDALPGRWLTGLLGRTTAYDDGRIFQLIAQARSLWAS
jgi:ADP-ribosyl-[dinitrogen reductase] hydrolase